jgi:hypothetical protein
VLPAVAPATVKETLMSQPSMFAALLIAFMALHAQDASAGVGMGVFTIVEGDLAVLRETRQFPAAEGMRLRAEDIVRSGTGGRLARLELDDGTLLDLGPDTELQLQPRGLGGERAATVYLLRGWLKVTTPPAGTTLASPRMDVRKIAGSAVLRITPQATLMFVESGRAELNERADGRQATHALREGDAFALRAGAAGAVLRRPPADLVDGLPRGFVDPLPRRAAAWRDRSVEPGAGAAVDYAVAAPWLHAESALRPAFVQRFTPMTRDRRFRASLVAELRIHPEWDRVLFPEKYRPKPPPVVVPLLPPAPAASALARTDGDLPIAVPRPWLEALEPGLSRSPAQLH